MKKLIPIAILMTLMVIMVKVPAMSADFTVVGKIDQISVNKNLHAGGCSIHVPQFTGGKPVHGSCLPEWISLQCDPGSDEFANPDNARLLYVQSAMAMNHDLHAKITVAQARKLDKECVAQNIVISRQPFPVL